MRIPRFERISENIIPDIRDNFPGSSRLREWEVSPSEQDPEAVERFKQQFFSADQHRELVAAAEFVAPGESYECLWNVGNRDEGTLHPHVFVVERDQEGLNVFFLDPEHNVGKQHKYHLRPAISNLIAIQVTPEYRNVRFNSLRFSTEGLTPDELKLQQQYEAARQMLKSQQPDMLAGKEEQVLFQAAIVPDSARLKARYTNEKKAQRFLSGGEGSRALRGKVKANDAIIKRLTGFLRDGHFKPLKHLRHPEVQPN